MVPLKIYINSDKSAYCSELQMHQCITTFLIFWTFWNSIYIAPTIAAVQTAEYGMCYCPFSTEQGNPTQLGNWNASDLSIATTRCTNLSSYLCVKHCKWVLILSLLPQCRFLFRSVFMRSVRTFQIYLVQISEFSLEFVLQFFQSTFRLEHVQISERTTPSV